MTAHAIEGHQGLRGRNPHQVSSQAIRMQKKKGKPKATKDGEGIWHLPPSYKAARRNLFDSDEDYAEYQQQMKEQSYKRLCERYRIERGGKKGPKGPWKYETCPTCGQKKAKRRAKEEADLSDADSVDHSVGHEDPAYSSASSSQEPEPQAA